VFIGPNCTWRRFFYCFSHNSWEHWKKNIFDVCTHCFLFQVFNKHYLECIAQKIDDKNLLFHIFFYFHQKMLPEDATIHSLSWFWVIGNTYIHMYGCFINWYTLFSDFATLWCSKFIILVASGVILGPPGHQNCSLTPNDAIFKNFPTPSKKLLQTCSWW